MRVPPDRRVLSRFLVGKVTLATLLHEPKWDDSFRYILHHCLMAVSVPMGADDSPDVIIREHEYDQGNDVADLADSFDRGCGGLQQD